MLKIITEGIVEGKKSQRKTKTSMYVRKIVKDQRCDSYRNKLKGKRTIGNGGINPHDADDPNATVSSALLLIVCDPIIITIFLVLV